MALGCQILPNGLPDPTMAQPAIVEVVEAVGVCTTFSLFYDINIVDGDISLLSEDRLGPEQEIVIRAADGDDSAILVRGPVTQQRIGIMTGGEGSQLEVIGADVAATMGREARVKIWPSTTDAAAIMERLSSAQINPAGVSLPTSVVHSETKNALVQREPDLHFIRRLARRNGCWFWLEYDKLTGLATAQIKRPPVDGLPALNFNLAGAERNVDEVSIHWDTERIVSTDAANWDGFSASQQSGSVERSPLSTLGAKPLADIVTKPRRARLSLPVDDAGDLIARSEAALIDEGWFIEATVTVRARRLKRIVRVAQIVSLHGAGKRHSGNYLVSRVIHRIDDDDHLMTATLVRNGWN
jgi:phage protein D